MFSGEGLVRTRGKRLESGVVSFIGSSVWSIGVSV